MWLDTPTQTGSTSKGPRGQHSASERVPVLKIPEAASSSKVLAAASRAALACLPHEQLVAAFDRVDAGIDSWQQLAPVLEEEEEEGGSWIWGQGAGGDNDSDQQEQQQQQGPEERMHTQASDQEPVEDKTFLTGELLSCVIWCEAWPRTGSVAALLVPLVLASVGAAWVQTCLMTSPHLQPLNTTNTN